MMNHLRALSLSTQEADLNQNTIIPIGLSLIRGYKMRIVTYDELEKKDELPLVLSLSFGSWSNPRQMDEIRRLNPRTRNGPGGFCALENNHIIGFVGVMEIPTRALNGDTEVVGGIWGVATHPGKARQGVSTELMNHAHEYFTKKGYRFSFLTTRKTYIAYAFYRHLSYEDAFCFPSAFKFLTKKRKSIEKRSARIPWKTVMDIYEEFTASRTGFVVRDVEFFKSLPRIASLDQGRPERIVVGERGYVFYSTMDGTLSIDELVSTDQDEMKNLITIIEGKARDVVSDRCVLNTGLFEAYRSRGYLTQTESHGLLMVKALAAATFDEVYGRRFYQTSLDLF
jgi:GNAT superfamily N-acetyltransferase